MFSFWGPLYDASPQIAKLASELIGKSVKILSFQELDYANAFDGIWACASLLHCRRAEIDSIIQRMSVALKPNGAIYMSFKYGEGERIDERGRFFNDCTEVGMSELLAVHPDLQLIEMFTESKPLRKGFQTWLNVFVKKQGKFWQKAGF